MQKEIKYKKDQKILKVGITGSSGHIGSVLRKKFCDKYNLFLYDIREAQPTHKATFIKIDLADREQLDGIFNGLDVLIHLGAHSSPYGKKEDIYRNNFMATSYVFEEARKAGVKKIVYASSNHYHGKDVLNVIKNNIDSNKFNFFKKSTQKLITLDTLPSPSTFYGESKVFGENLGRHLSYAGIQFVALRIGWTLQQDNPFTTYDRDYMRAMFCSQRDLIQAFEKSIEIETTFLRAFVISNNSKKVFDLTETIKKLGFNPEDNAENYF